MNNTPLYILPCDHRGSFAHDLLGKPYPVKGQDKQTLIACKEIVLDAILYTKNQYKGDAALATIIDEEFGTPVIRRAKKLSLPFALTTEGATHDVYHFLHGDSFGSAITKINPTFVKALIYYTPGNEKANKITRARLLKLSKFCTRESRDFMLEVLVGTMAESKKEEAIGSVIDELQAAGITPNIWKVEGLPTSIAWKRLAKHTSAAIIVLGRGESKKQVELWLRAAAKSGVVLGFAVGRTVFLKPLQNFLAGKLTRPQTVDAIAKNYLKEIKTWEKNR
jgi:myo-inositol catabolism protein IolC